MRILVLTKRQYTGKDLLADRFGRLFEIPAELSRRGHEVRGMALSYRSRGRQDFVWEDLPGLAWRSVDALPSGILRYASALDNWTREWQPEVVWASSDMLHAVLAERWTRSHRLPLVLDLYDNYEGFGLSKVPGLTNAFRHACQRARVLTVVSHTLAGYVSSRYGLRCPAAVLTNGVRRDHFRPRDRCASRVALGLPTMARIVGTAGAITRSRGIEVMFQAFLEMAESDPNLWLVHAGPVDRDILKRYQHPRIRGFGMLAIEQVPQVLACLDVAVICNRDSDFGRYCFPLKLHEIMAMRIPFVAAAVGDVKKTLAAYPHLLFAPGNVRRLKEAITVQLSHAEVPMMSVPSWGDCTDTLEDILEREISDR